MINKIEKLKEITNELEELQKIIEKEEERSTEAKKMMKKRERT